MPISPLTDIFSFAFTPKFKQSSKSDKRNLIKKNAVLSHDFVYYGQKGSSKDTKTNPSLM